MQKKVFTFVAIFIIAVCFSACTEKPENVLVEKSKMNALSKEDMFLAEEYNADFEQVALAVSQLIATNSEFKQILQKEVAEKFDGDYNVLISQLVKNYSSVESWFEEKNVEIRGIVEKYPLIQIAIPINFENFVDNNKMKIVFLPMEFDDIETKTVYGYNLKGENTEYQVNSDCDYSVVVISENERTEILEKPQRFIILSAPINMTATPHPDGIMLNWENTNTCDFSGYKIYKTDGASEKIYIIWGSNKTSFFDYDVEIENNYTYYVVAFIEFLGRHYIFTDNIFDLYNVILSPVYSEPSNTANAVIYRDYPTQTLLIDNGNNNNLNLTWGHLTYNPQSIELWRKIEGEQYYSQIASFAGNVNNYLEQSPNNDKLYQYKVRAIKPNGNYSEWSNLISTYSGERNNGCNLKMKNLKFETEADLRKYESNVRGDAELVFYIYMGDATQAQNLKIIYTPDVGYNYYTNLSDDGIILRQWNIVQNNGYGSILTFHWYEKDVKTHYNWTQYPQTYYEDRNRMSDRIREGEKDTIYYNAAYDVLGDTKSFWWDKKNKRYVFKGLGYTLE
ncbi:MAG: hypothetical protein LBN95_12475 [Prevotellaceae bacterium]|jgi:hypothetical protein|nr:hypothetical protein [Prevotellaceae bacterium]